MELLDTVSSSDLLIWYDAIIVFLVFMFPFSFFFLYVFYTKLSDQNHGKQ